MHWHRQITSGSACSPERRRHQCHDLRIPAAIDVLEHLSDKLAAQVLFRPLLLQVVEGELQLRDGLLHLLILVHAQHAGEDRSDYEGNAS